MIPDVSSSRFLKLSSFICHGFLSIGQTPAARGTYHISFAEIVFTLSKAKVSVADPIVIYIFELQKYKLRFRIQIIK